MLKKLRRIFASKAKGFQPRAARIPIEPLSGVSFSGFDVVNLSEDGVGLSNTLLIAPPEVGEVLSGSLTLPSARFPVELKVAFVSRSAIGCAFVGEFSGLKSEIQRHFKIQLSALQLIEVNPEILKEEKDGKARLFRGQNNCELFFVEDAGKIARFQLSFFGNYVEGGAGLRTRFGFLSAGIETDKPKYKGSSLVRLVPELSPEVLKSASTFLDHIPELSAAQRAEIRKAIKRSAS